MNDLTEITGKVKERFEQVNQSLGQLAKASRGLVVRLTDEGSKQFEALVKVGETQQSTGSGKSFLVVIKESLNSGDQGIQLKGSVNQVKLAALGLVTKTRENSQRIFNELVVLGGGEGQVVAATTPAPRAKKSSTKGSK